MISVNSVIFGDDMLNQRCFFIKIVVINFCQIFWPQIPFMLGQSCFVSPSSFPNGKWAINISKHRLTKTKTKVLALGSNFGVSQKTIPKQKIISKAEKGLRLFPISVTNITRNKIISVINSYKKVPSNLTNEEKLYEICQRIRKSSLHMLTKETALWF